MAVASAEAVPSIRKRKRRRQDKSPITARLVLDDHVRGDVGILSEDLFADLFPAIVHEQELVSAESASLDCYHVAICPWDPSTVLEDSTWNIVHIRPSSALAHSTVQFSPSSLALQGFAEMLSRLAPSKLVSHSRSGIDIKIIDVQPLGLDTVFVTIEADLARRLENGEGTFHVEHIRADEILDDETSLRRPEDHLSSAVREALAALKIVHTGDYFSLPLRPHPITHIPPPPARVALCEPLSQGVLTPNSKIVISLSGHSVRSVRKLDSLSMGRGPNRLLEADEDTSNDQFFSAAEDRYKTDVTLEDDEPVTETENEVSEEDQDGLSDDSIDDMISLQAPVLATQVASGISTVQGATPQNMGRGRRTDETHTPGSVFSSFTATTARAGGQKGRLFKAQGLIEPVIADLLHPKPGKEDDGEARVFVDVNSLTKIGCFSGDWVRLEAAEEPPSNGTGLWGLGSFGTVDAEEVVWKPVKVFGLPESFSYRPITKILSQKHEGRRLSFFESQIKKPPDPTAYLSPLLLANMGHTPYCRLSPLRRVPQASKAPSLKTSSSKITSSSQPPLARELTLVRISTPISTERPLQNALFAALKQYFACCNRIVSTGDLVGIAVDENLGRTLYQSTSSEDTVSDELVPGISLNYSNIVRPQRPTGVAWFKIGYVGITREDDNLSEAQDIWGGTASVDAASTRMLQSGSEGSRLPGTLENPWEYYLGLKSIPRSETAYTSVPEAPRCRVSSLHRRLRELIAAATSPRAIYLNLRPLAILLISTQRSIGKAMMAEQACADIGLHCFTIDGFDVVSDGGAGSDVRTASYLEARAERAMSCGPAFCALLIRHLEALTADRMVATLTQISEGARVFIATTTELDKIPDSIRGIFTHEVEMNAPDEWEREGILETIVNNQTIAPAPDVDLGAVAVKTAALVAGDLVDVVGRALVARSERLGALALASSDSNVQVLVRDLLIAGGPAARCLTRVDFDVAVDAARKNFADAIGAPKIPNVSWDDVGGLTNVKDAVLETIQLPLERPELFAKGMKKRSGILFYGPPGTGKTLLAKAIATEFSLNFFSIKGPELLNMYIGESEANVRRVFQRARDARPCVVFFDELDSVAPKRGNQGDSGGVMDRIVSQLLAELDGMSNGEQSGGGVFVIGATNRPDLLDAALLRPGRFDKMLYLGISDTHEKQIKIMEALTRKFTLHPELSLKRVASKLPFTYTGADFYALCSDAMLKAVTRQASVVDSKIARINTSNVATGKGKISIANFFDHYATKDDVAVMVTEADFDLAERELVPSVSAKELEHYRRVRAQFEKVEDGRVQATRERRKKDDYPHKSGWGKGKSSIYESMGKGKPSPKWEQETVEDDRHDNKEGGLHVNGHSASLTSRVEGKGKAVDMRFYDGTLDDEEILY